MARELMALGASFLLAGVLARGGGKVGLPTIPLFILAGMIVGPHTPGAVLFKHPDELELLAAFGLIFLLFHLGVEFSVEDLVAGGRPLLASAGIRLLLNIGCGVAFGFALGWGSREALVIAGATGLSSSAIVTKVLVELRRLANVESPLILGTAVMEDLFVALYLAALAPVFGKADGVAESLWLFARAAGFLVLLALVARYGAGWIGKLVSGVEDELLIVSFIGFAFLVAGLSAEIGVSEAVGAFMAGLILARTPSARRIERFVLPLRDAFGALFFFAFGLSIDPAGISEIVVPAVAAILMSLVLALVTGVIAARFTGLDRLATANLAATLVSRGEFALILVALTAGAGLDPRLSPFVALYVLVLAVLSPILATRSHLVARVIPSRLIRT